MSDTRAVAEGSALSATVAPSRLQLASLPPEILDLILQAYIDDHDACKSTNNIASALATCTLFHHILLRKLYASLRFHSAKQVFKFTCSGHHSISHPRRHTRSVVINIPGVPGGRYETGILEAKIDLNDFDLYSECNRITYASDVLLRCHNVRSVSFEFFSARINVLGREASQLEIAFRRLWKLERFRWVPPQRDANAIKGLSIVIIDLLVAPIAGGIEAWPRLQWLELWNVLLPANGGHQLAQALIQLSTERAREGVKRDLEFTLRSVTHLDPNAIADLALAHPPIKVNVADGFVDSIWGDRVTQQAVEQCVRRKLESDSCVSIANDPGSMPLSIEQKVADAMKNVRITVLKDGVAGSQESMQSTD